MRLRGEGQPAAGLLVPRKRHESRENAYKRFEHRHPTIVAEHGESQIVEKGGVGGFMDLVSRIHGLIRSCLLPSHAIELRREGIPQPVSESVPVGGAPLVFPTVRLEVSTECRTETTVDDFLQLGQRWKGERLA